MLRIGNVNPDSMNAGWMKKNASIIACCCVRLIVDRNSPAPSVLSRNNAAVKARNRALPRNGTWNSSSASAVTSTESAKPTSANGIVFPSISSIGRMGVTMICSIVPISFSRTIDSAVRISVTIMMMFTSTPGTK